MKKSLLLMAVVLSSLFGKGQTVLKALNGYSRFDAITMIQNFKDKNSQPTSKQAYSVWFSEKFIKAVSKLLEDEKLNPSIAGMPKADGIRIYFARDANGAINVVIVTTYDTGIINLKTNSDYHEDYFEHSSMADVFNLKDASGQLIPISGEVCTGVACNGAKVYATCPPSICPDDPSCPQGPHYLTRKQCEDMAQGFGTQKVNTVSEWFDSDLIKTLANDPKPGFDGVRIYFARHPVNDIKYSGKDAFVIVTTQTTGSGQIRQDYFDCGTTARYFTQKEAESQKLKGARSFKRIQPLKKKARVNHNAKATSRTSGSDNGELCPDNCTLP